MRTTIVRAMVVTLAVATFGILTLSPAARALSGEGGGGSTAREKYQAGYIEGYERAYNETTRAQENQAQQDSGDSGGSCG